MFFFAWMQYMFLYFYYTLDLTLSQKEAQAFLEYKKRNVAETNKKGDIYPHEECCIEKKCNVFEITEYCKHVRLWMGYITLIDKIYDSENILIVLVIYQKKVDYLW